MKVQLHHTRVFKNLWENAGDFRLMANRGGARSSKTWSIMQAICIWLLTGQFGKAKIPKGSFGVCRETLPALRNSALKDCLEILHQMGIYHKIDHRKTVLELHYKKRYIRFFSTDDLNSAKLRGVQNTCLFMNEANTISFEAFSQMEMRTEQFIIMDYNPASMDSWVRTFIEGKQFKKGIVNLDVSTYYDNIKHLPQPMIDSIEGLKEVDNDLYRVYTKGEWVKSRNLVFAKIHLIKQMPTTYEREFWGLDFGFNDPCVCVRVLKDKKDLYIEQIIYKTKLGLNDIAGLLHDAMVGKVYADHEPLTIKELKARGIRIKKANKGKDSIRQGLGFIRQHKIHILETSLETIKEFREYKYTLDKENDPTDKPLPIGDHSIDATRMALSFALRNKIRIV